MRELQIGEIKFSPGPVRKEIFLTCYLPHKSELNIKLFDEYGFSRRTEIFPLEKGEHKVKLDCSGLSAGDYSVWIEVEKKTFLRSFSIKGKKKKLSLIKRLKKLFWPDYYRGAYY